MQGNEELEWIFRVGFSDTASDFFLDFVLSLLSVTICIRLIRTPAEPSGLLTPVYLPCESQQLLLVCPQDGFVLLDIYHGHDIVKSDNHILGLVANHNEKASLLLLEPISNERADALVSARLVSYVATI